MIVQVVIPMYVDVDVEIDGATVNIYGATVIGSEGSRINVPLDTLVDDAPTAIKKEAVTQDLWEHHHKGPYYNDLDDDVIVDDDGYCY